MDRLVPGAWLEKQLGAPDLRILDCTVSSELLPQGARGYRSGRAAWAQGHIPGSGHVDLMEELSDLSSGLPFMLPLAEQFSAVMSRHGIGDGNRIVVYDSFMNVWATRVWWMLRAFGFDEAAVLDGGWQAWIADGRPSTTYPEPNHASVRFVARPRLGLFVGKEEVLAAIDQKRRHRSEEGLHRGRVGAGGLSRAPSGLPASRAYPGCAQRAVHGAGRSRHPPLSSQGSIARGGV